MATILTGGGYGSRQHIDKKVEPVTHRGNVAGVAQQGMATAFRKEPLIQGKGYESGPMPATGVRGIYNSATSGPGSGRTVYPSGSQGATPVAREMPPGRTFDERPNKSDRP